MISEFSCPGGAREPISPTQLYVQRPTMGWKMEIGYLWNQCVAE